MFVKLQKSIEMGVQKSNNLLEIFTQDLQRFNAEIDLPLDELI
jgi:hypothetical protein